MEASTPSGLTIVGQTARSIAATVAPYSSPIVHGMSVPPVQPWAGWPNDPNGVQWATPLWDQQSSGGGLLGTYVSTVYTCVDLNSRQIATMPIYRMRGVEHMPGVSWMTNPAPELYADWGEAARQIVNSLLMRGEAFIYALARFADGTVARFVVLNPDVVQVDWINGEIGYTLSGGTRLDSRDVCHVRYQSWPSSLRGISPLEWVGRNLVGAVAMESYQAQLAANGGVPWAVLTAPGNLTAEQADANRARWSEASARRGAAPVMLGGGLTLQTLTLSPTDMALLDLRVFDEQRICAAFGVPPYLVGLPQAEGLTYSNASSLFDFHWRATLRPITRMIASAISGWALPAGQRVEFNSDEYVRPDFAARAQAYSVLHGIEDEGGRAITVEEIRQMERFETQTNVPNSGAALSGPIGVGMEAA